jgi:hypothetical protein
MKNIKNKKNGKVSSAKDAWLNKKIPPRLKFILLCFVQFLLALTSIYVVMKANTIANTANLLQINNEIQLRTSAVMSAEMKRKELEMRVNINNDESNDYSDDVNIRAELILTERRAAIISLLNTYEFACIQYIENKIDKKAFKLLYNETIKVIKNEYSNYFIGKGSQENYQAINKVYKEWTENHAL